MVPKAAELRLALAARKFVLLSRLKTSVRNSSRVPRQPRSNTLLRARSSWKNGSLRTELRLALPKGWLGSVGITTASLLKKFVGERSGEYGSPTMLGR